MSAGTRLLHHEGKRDDGLGERDEEGRARGVPSPTAGARASVRSTPRPTITAETPRGSIARRPPTDAARPCERVREREAGDHGDRRAPGRGLERVERPRATAAPGRMPRAGWPSERGVVVEAPAVAGAQRALDESRHGEPEQERGPRERGRDARGVGRSAPRPGAVDALRCRLRSRASPRPLRGAERERDDRHLEQREERRGPQVEELVDLDPDFRLDGVDSRPAEHEHDRERRRAEQEDDRRRGGDRRARARGAVTRAKACRGLAPSVRAATRRAGIEARPGSPDHARHDRDVEEGQRGDDGRGRLVRAEEAQEPGRAEERRERRRDHDGREDERHADGRARHGLARATAAGTAPTRPECPSATASAVPPDASPSVVAHGAPRPCRPRAPCLARPGEAAPQERDRRPHEHQAEECERDREQGPPRRAGRGERRWGDAARAVRASRSRRTSTCGCTSSRFSAMVAGSRV